MIVWYLTLLTNIPIAYTINTCYHGGGAHIRFRLQLDTNVVEGHPITIDEVT
jgi:hypothetical protein